MNPYFLFVVCLMLASTAFSNFVDWLNYRHALSNKIPEEFREICDAEKFRSSQDYLAATTKYGLLKSFFDLPMTLLVLFSGAFGMLDHFARATTQSEITSGLVFFASLGLLAQIYSLPFSLYETFVLEARFGFNKTTGKTFVLDLIKGLLLTALIGGPLLAGLLWFFLHFGHHAWLYAWAFLSLCQIFLLTVASSLIMPLFNKFKALEQGELRTAIENYAAEQKFTLQNIFVMDGSKRSSKANAFFTGFGRFRRVVLFDTLIASQSVAELVAVLAHEIGHFKRRHIWKFLFLSLGMLFLLFYFFSLFIGNEKLSAAFGFLQNSIYASLLCIMFIYSPISQLFSILKNYISRSFEFEADAYAVKTTGSSKQLISALKKLSISNLSNLNPHWLKVFLEYSHPPVVDRIRMMTLGSSEKRAQGSGTGA